MAGQDLITVKLQTITDVKYEVRVRPTESILDLKNQLAKRHDIKNKIQLMMNKEELKDSLQIERYGIEAGSVLQMLLVPAKDIKITFNVFKKGTVTLNATDTHTVADLRKELLKEEYKLGLSPKFLDYYFDNKKLDLDKPLYEYGVAGDCEIDLLRHDLSFKICVRMYKEPAHVKVRAKDTVKSIQDKVLHIVNSKGKESNVLCERSDLLLFHQSSNKPVFTELDDETAELISYNVKPGDSIVCLEYNLNYPETFTCIINGSYRTVYYIPPLTDRVLEYKLKIQDQHGIAFHRLNVQTQNGIIRRNTDTGDPRKWIVKTL